MDKSYKSKDVKASINEFKDGVDDLLGADSNVFDSKLKKLIYIIENNEILKSIINPYLEYKLNYEEIEMQDTSGWLNINFPTDKNGYIAYVLQLLYTFSERKYYVFEYGVNVFRKTRNEEVLYLLNNQILLPCFRELFYKLNEVLENEINNTDIIQSSKIQIFNVRNITSTGSTFAFGKNITQNTSYNQGLTDNVVKELLENGFKLKNIDAIRSVLEDLEDEIKKEIPNEGKLKKIFSTLYQFGEKLMLRILEKYITRQDVVSVMNESML